MLSRLERYRMLQPAHHKGEPCDELHALSVLVLSSLNQICNNS